MTRCLRARFFIAVSAVLVGVIVGGCPLFQPPNTNPGDTNTPAKLVKFESAKALLDYFKQQAMPKSGQIAYPTMYDSNAVRGAAPVANGASTGGAEDTAAGGSSDQSFSTTNVQEEGVDESDVFKSDGTYFYIAKDQTLRIVRAHPADQMAEVSKLDLGMYVDSLYLQGSSVIALGMEYPTYVPMDAAYGRPTIMIWPPYYGGSKLHLKQVDVTDPANPSVSHDLQLDGSVVSSRLTNGRLILVLTILPNLPTNLTTSAVNGMSLNEVMPKMQPAAGTAVDMVPWENWLRPVSPDGYCMTAVVTIDAANVENKLDSVAVLANAGTIYASTEALYVTDAQYDPSDNYREKTAIHKFAFNADGVAEYAASGSVPGRLLNQFSLDEYQGYLRVATHINNFTVFPMGSWAEGNAGMTVSTEARAADINSNVPYNGVYVLNQESDALNLVGAVDGLAPNENIYSARFIGARGYLVTFRQIDPLFVIDLTDPANPTRLADLKVPGYSDYLHPLGDTHLIGVGHSIARTIGGFTEPAALQLSLFDVSDPADPKLVQQIATGGMFSSSEVSQTHKAFTLIEHNGQTLIAIPATLTRDDNTYYSIISFDGVICYRVDPAAGFTELGRIQQAGGNDLWAAWHRAAFISDDLYAVSSDGVRTTPLADFTVAHELLLGD
jgi:inhibitor of cysteine peptidase